MKKSKQARKKLANKKSDKSNRKKNSSLDYKSYKIQILTLVATILVPIVLKLIEVYMGC